MIQQKVMKKIVNNCIPYKYEINYLFIKRDVLKIPLGHVFNMVANRWCMVRIQEATFTLRVDPKYIK